ncbi:MAG TPA: ATP-binding cassette domain-containing protein [Alphaproteobacteria bacterium]
MVDKVIDVKNIVNRFGTKTVHDHLNLHLDKGEILGLIGGSGSGKSVLLRTILGLLKPKEGTVMLLGKNPYDLNEQQRRALFQRVGVLFQDGALFSGLNVFDNIGFPLREYQAAKGNEIEEKVYDVLDKVGLERDVAQKYPAELSGGMTRRAALARALVMEPEILFLDEPTGPLDPVAADDFDELILSLRKNLDLSVLIITHDLNTLIKICTRIAMIVDKKIIDGSIDDMIKNKNADIQAFFHGARMNALSNARKAA